MILTSTSYSKILRQSLLGFFLLCGLTSLALAASKPTSLNESISVGIDISGDISGSYDFNGGMGEDLEGQARQAQAICQTWAHFRRALYQHKSSVEVWVKFKCTEEGQKKTYQPSRFFIDPTQETVEIQLPILDRPLKNLHLKFHDLSFKKGN